MNVLIWSLFEQACLDEHEINVSAFIHFGAHGLGLKKNVDAQRGEGAQKRSQKLTTNKAQITNVMGCLQISLLISSTF